MRKLVLAVAFLAMGAIVTSQCPAAENNTEGKRPRTKKAVKRMHALADKLDLSEDQRSRVRQIIKSHHKEISNWREQNTAELKNLQNRMKQARQNKDAEAVKEIRNHIGDILSERKKLTEDLHDKLSKVLDEQQMSKVRRLMHSRRSAGKAIAAMKRLDLNEQQKSQAKEILKDARAKAKDADSPQEKAKIMRSAHDKIKKNVLTEKQSSQLLRMRRHNRVHRAFGQLDLTDGQKQQIHDIMSKARKDASQASGREEKREILMSARKSVGKVLTDQQREKLRKIRRSQLRRNRRHNRIDEKNDGPRGQGRNRGDNN